eukprot:1648076-Alexandrium_andersonii.AAC.1
MHEWGGRGGSARDRLSLGAFSLGRGAAATRGAQRDVRPLGAGPAQPAGADRRQTGSARESLRAWHHWGSDRRQTVLVTAGRHRIGGALPLHRNLPQSR